MKTYETGSEHPTHAILYIYDIFGLYPQTLRGADILAKSVAHKTGNATKVFMPDWFAGPADIYLVSTRYTRESGVHQQFLFSERCPECHHSTNWWNLGVY